MVAAGARHSLLLTDTGRLFAMGDNTWAHPASLSKYVKSSLRHGQLGMESRTHGSFVDTRGCRISFQELEPRPRSVEGALGDEEVEVKLIAAGDSFTMAVTEDDQLYTWGANANGQLGSATV